MSKTPKRSSSSGGSKMRASASRGSLSMAGSGIPGIPSEYAFPQPEDEQAERLRAKTKDVNQTLKAFASLMRSNSEENQSKLIRDVFDGWIAEWKKEKSGYETLIRSKAFRRLTGGARPSSTPSIRYTQYRPAVNAGETPTVGLRVRPRSIGAAIAGQPYRPGSSSGSRPGPQSSVASTRPQSSSGLHQSSLSASFPELSALPVLRKALPSGPEPEKSPFVALCGAQSAERSEVELLRMFREVGGVSRGTVPMAWIDTATRMIRFHGVDVNARDMNGVGMVHYLAKSRYFNSSSGATLAQLMFEAGGKATEPDSSGYTPLQLALKHGNSVIGREILKHGWGVIHQVTDDQALQWAEKTQEPWIISLMVAAAENGESQALIHRRLQKWRLEEGGAKENAKATAKLLDTGPLGVVTQGHDATVARLLSNRADPCAAMSDGTTVAHLAAKLDHHRILVLVIRARAHIDARDDQGRTPLCVAAGCEAADTVETLLHLSANAGIPNNQGDTPLIVAMKRAREFRAEGLDEAEDIKLARAVRSARALRTKFEPWAILETELNRSKEDLAKDIELNAFCEAAKEKLTERGPHALYNESQLQISVTAHKETRRGAFVVGPQETALAQLKIAALMRRGFGAIDAPILGPDGFPALNDRMQLRSQLFEDNEHGSRSMAKVICDRVITPLMELLSEQELSDDVQGCKMRTFARYILGCGIVPLMKQTVARAVISAESRIAGVLNVGITAATEILEKLTPEVRGLVNSGHAWNDMHQAHAHGEAPVRWAQGGIAQGIGALLAMGAVDHPRELCQVIQQRQAKDGKDFGKEGSFWRFAYALWLQTLARRVDSTFQQKMQALTYSLVRRNRDVVIHRAWHRAAPVKGLEKILLRQGQYLERTKKLFPLFGDRLAAGGLCDICRCSLTFDTPEQVKDCFDRLLKMTIREDGAEAVMYRNRFHPKAVVADQLTPITVVVAVPVPNTGTTACLHLCEVQLHLAVVIDAKRSFLLLKDASGDLGREQRSTLVGSRTSLIDASTQGSKFANARASQMWNNKNE